MDNLFQPGKNCWRTGRVTHGSLLVDSANFYRAIQESIARAQHSIFILGWEIDSQIHLLRGEEEKNSPWPSVVVDLLAWKAEQNPNLSIYLLRWDSSIVFVNERELFTEHAWAAKTPPNVHVCLDSTIAMGGSHHQKIILIDDELVFTGGMDIARQRWDERTHRIHEPGRVDSSGPYGPYHDTQIVVDGPIVKNFSELCRWRWKRAAGYDAVETRPLNHSSLDKPVPSWPSKFTPVFKHMNAALSRTIPWMGDSEESLEVLQMYLDLINSAEEFIYMENQFFTHIPIAEALNWRLREKPQLRALLVSSYNPQGIFEAEGLWAGRIDFKKAFEKGVKARAKLVCVGLSGSKEYACHKRIHSKILVVDDRYLTVGSANVNNRSMALDTECDLVFSASHSQEREWIAQARNDLISEHTSLEISKVAEFVRSQSPLSSLLNAAPQGQYTLSEVNDSRFTKRFYTRWAKIFADPKEPLMQIPLPGNSRPLPLKNPRKARMVAGLFLFLVVMGLLIFIREHWSWFQPDNIVRFLQQSRSSPWAFPIVCLVYIVGGFVLFPVTVLSLITAGVFGAFWGPIYGMTGALLSATLMFYMGRWAGSRGLRRLFGARLQRIDQRFKDTGVLGMTALRLLPIAPFSIVNVAAGMSSVSFINFILGSFLGFLPAFLAKGILGDSLVQFFIHPDKKSAIYFGIGIAIWLVLVLGSYFGVRHWQKARSAG